MFALKVENPRHEILRLTQNESAYQVLKVEGVDAPKATINSHSVAGMDGTKMTSTKLEERNLVITVKIRGDIERNRQVLYNFFRTKEWCKVYFTNANRNVYIEGYVESASVDIFSNKEIMQISIICNNPYFKGIQEVSKMVSVWVSNFEFPFSIGVDGIPFTYFDTNTTTSVVSESECGCEIDIDFNSNVNSIIINNVTTSETMSFNYAFRANDRLRINTNKGQKKIILERNFQETNLIGALADTSKFFTIIGGENLFNYEIDGDIDNNSNVQITIRFSNLYRGV